MEINRINFSVPRRYAGELESLLFWAGFSFVRIKRKAWIHRGACSSLPFEFDVCTGKLLLPHLVGRGEGGFSLAPAEPVRNLVSVQVASRAGFPTRLADSPQPSQASSQQIRVCHRPGRNSQN